MPKIKKEQPDLTTGPILKTLLAFSFPTLFANMLQTLSGTINTIWVGQLLGDRALAATANANIVMFLLFALIMGMGMATTIRVGLWTGAHDLDGARRALGTGLGFATALSVIAGIGGYFFSDPLLYLMATPAEIHTDSRIYLEIIFLSMPFTTFSMLVAMGLRGNGDAKTPMYAMVLNTILVIVLNPLLIEGWGPIPSLGIAGSALASTIASFAGTIGMVIWIYGKDLPMRLRGPEWSYLWPTREELAYIITKGLPTGGQIFISAAAGVVMIGLVNAEGMISTAAYGAALQIWTYLQMPAFAISTAVSTMAAQSLGAQLHERVLRVTSMGVNVNILMTGVLTLLLVLIDGPLLTLFLGSGSEAVPLAQHVQRVSTWSFIVQGMVMVYVGTMRAYGVVIIPMIVTIISLYPARLGFYWLTYPYLGADAIWWSYPAGSIMSLVLMYGVYKFGSWRPIKPQVPLHHEEADAIQTPVV